VIGQNVTSSTSTVVGCLEREGRQGFRSIRLRCPICQSGFPDVPSQSARLTCSACAFEIPEVNGIFHALTPQGKARFATFVRDYENVRTQEGWGSPGPDYYLALPFRDLTNKHSWIWQIRAHTLLYMQNRVLPRAQPSGSSPLRILDIGAGNGWLSYKLSQLGHDPIAVDLLDNDTDGLGAARHYLAQLQNPFPRFQAEMDRLPFDSEQFDVAIFNASFHYSSDYEKSLREVTRCVRHSGLVIIADTPFYWRDESGRRMLEERRASFERQFGVCSDGIRSGEYLTPATLDELAQSLGIQWNVCKPWYGLQWALRPAKARLLGRREPSKFYLFWFRQK
jgi:ubiquinone/menaquinone biosynthesis C-methylase UbiE